MTSNSTDVSVRQAGWNRVLWIVVLSTLSVVEGTLAQTCPHLLNRQLFAQNSIVFLAQVMDAELVRPSDGSASPGKIVANFELIETYRGNPAEITHIVSYLDPNSELEPVHSVYLGQQVLIFANQKGEYIFNLCTAHQARTRDGCNVYELQSLAGISHPEDRNCEAAMMHARFMERGVRPNDIQWDDLEALRATWKNMFGEEP